MRTTPAAAAWVSNGRKLEDLQGDCKDEWVSIQDVAHGHYATIVSCKNGLENNIGDIIHRVRGGFAHGSYYWLDDPSYDMMVWPIRTDLGDTITIGG